MRDSGSDNRLDIISGKGGKMKKIIVLGLLFVSVPVFAMGKNPLIGVKAQLAEQVKLADTLNSKISAVETANLKLADKVENQVMAIGYMKGDLNKVSSEIKASSGRDTNINDSQLMKEYIQSMKDSHTEVVGLMWKIVWLLIIELTAIIGVFGGYLFFTIKSLLSARDVEDNSDNEILKSILKKEK